MSGCDLLKGLFCKTSYLEVVEERLGLSLDEAQVLEEWDTHGGFHGDGETFVKMSVPDGFEQTLGIGETVDGKAGDGWYALPLTGTAYDYFYEWGGLFEHPETGERVIPEVSNGYWYYTATGAMNWDFSILDIDENVLYFYEWDA
jgi:hypothetical protein